MKGKGDYNRRIKQVTDLLIRFDNFAFLAFTSQNVLQEVKNFETRNQPKFMKGKGTIMEE